MDKKTLILIVLCMCNFVKPKDNDNQEVPVAFKKLGYLATGNHYGHLYTEVDINQIRLMIQNATDFLDSLQVRQESKTAKRMVKALSGFLNDVKTTVDKVYDAFYDGKYQQNKKRDLGFGLGLVNLGLSVYNTYKIFEVEKSISGMSETLELVSESVIEQDHALTMLEEKLNNITMMFIKVQTEIIQYEVVESMVRNFHSHILLWAGGIEALLYGQLHPSLIRPDTLKTSLEKLQEKAGKRGLIPLASDLTAVFKQEISFMAKDNGKLKIFIHIPLMDREPLELYEHLEIPIRVSEKLLWFVTAEEYNVLAIDRSSIVGLQMRKLELSNCKIKVSPQGKVYFCPNTGLVKNHIIETCLGALMLRPQDADKKCQLYVAKVKEFSIQTGPKTIIAYIKESDFLYQICDDGKRVQRKERGLTKLHVDDRCTLISSSFIFKPEEDITMESDFLESIMPIDLYSFHELEKEETELQSAIKGLDEIYPTKRRSVQQLKVWITKNDQRNQQSLAITVLISVAAGLAVVSVVLISVLYYKYKKEKREEKAEKAKDFELSARECQEQS